MPSLTFVLPHWLYWAGLLLFPLAAMYIVRRLKPRGAEGAVNIPIAYMFLVTAGFLGIHRFYLRNLWGFVFLPIFIAVLYFNLQTRESRILISNARNEVKIAEFELDRAQDNVRGGAAGAEDNLNTRQEALTVAKTRLTGERDDFDYWNSWGFWTAVLIGLMIAIEAFLIPGMVRARYRIEVGAEHPPGPAPPADEAAPVTHQHPAAQAHAKFSAWVDKISGFTGEFVCYWSLIAVFVYYYEVIARYVFNSPTNWAHESMFLMFGMQYLISGAYLLREDSHVRVDVIYLMFSDRFKAITDIVTSLFFFLFTGGLLWTGWVFAMDAIMVGDTMVWEVSFTEWAIQYWPVKISIGLGAFLLVMQGLTKLSKDVIFLIELER